METPEEVCSLREGEQREKEPGSHQGAHSPAGLPQLSQRESSETLPLFPTRQKHRLVLQEIAYCKFEATNLSNIATP